MKPRAHGYNVSIREIRVSEVRIDPGQILTVWIDGIQIEIRHASSGPELFCDELEKIEKKGFDEWGVIE